MVLTDTTLELVTLTEVPPVVVRLPAAAAVRVNSEPVAASASIDFRMTTPWATRGSSVPAFEGALTDADGVGWGRGR